MEEPERILLTAAGKAIAEKLKDDDQVLEPGKYPVDEVLHLHVQGVIEKGECQEYLASPPLSLHLFAALLAKKFTKNSKAGRDAAREAIAECAAAALGQAPETTGFDDRLRDAEDAIKTVLEESKVSKSRIGATTWKGVAEIE